MLKLISSCSSGSFSSGFFLRWWWMLLIWDSSGWSRSLKHWSLHQVVMMSQLVIDRKTSLKNDWCDVSHVFPHHGHLLLPIYGIPCMCECAEETQRTVAIRPPGGAARWLGEGPVQPWPLKGENEKAGRTSGSLYWQILMVISHFLVSGPVGSSHFLWQWPEGWPIQLVNVKMVTPSCLRGLQ